MGSHLERVTECRDADPAWRYDCNHSITFKR
jgi:hypothetical protein